MLLFKTIKAPLAALIAPFLISGCLQTPGPKPDADNQPAGDKASAKLIDHSESPWRLVALYREGKEQSIESLIGDDKSDHSFEITLLVTSMDPSGRAIANGIVGCNRWRGNAIFEDNTIRLTNAATTRMRCHYANSALEKLANNFLPSMEQAHTVRRQSERLTLSDEGAQEVTSWIFQH